MKRFLFYSFLLTVAPVLLLGQPQAILPEKHFEFLEKNCLECHDSDTRKGRVDLEALPFDIKTLEHAESWQKVLNAINSKEMPPEDKPQPTPVEKTDFLASLSETLVVARDVLSDSGGVATMRRLSRREYKNTIHDLLGISITAGSLPSDHTEGAFDTTGSSLYMSSDQIENYRKIALGALNEAIKVAVSDRKLHSRRIDFEEFRNPIIEKELAEQVSIQKRFSRWARRVDLASRQPKNIPVRNAINAEIKGQSKWEFYRSWEKIEGAPAPLEFGFKDTFDIMHQRSQWEWLMPHLLAYSVLPNRDTGVYITTSGNAQFHNHFHIHQHWPPGDYKMKFNAARVGARSIPNKRKDMEAYTLTAPGADRCFLDLDSLKGRFTMDSFQVNGTIDKPEPVEVTVYQTPGELLAFSLHERGTIENRVRFLNRDLMHSCGVFMEPAIWVESVEMTGPHYSNDEKKSFDQLKNWVSRLEKNEADLLAIIREFSTAAMRGRSPSEAFLDQLHMLYQDSRESGLAPRAALAETFSIILASPGFLYLAEKPSPSEEVTDLELASRLSYFLTGGPPDELLLASAAAGNLKDLATLQSHTARLLRHEELDRFIIPFLEQWLGLDRLDFFQFDTDKHRDYTIGVKKASRREIYETFKYWIQENGSLRHLLSSDTIVINALLADLYQIPGVKGDQFRPVKVPADSPRGGLLGMAAVSAMGSNGKDSSPVERGAWVLRKLMNNPPPPAPPNIPQLSRLGEKKLSTRELVSMHQEEAQCAQCHRKIDPIGFGLENFDAAGKWRTMDDRKGIPAGKRAIDPSGKIYNDSEFKNFYELRSIIAQSYIDNFAHGFTENLAEFALGRRIGFTDQGFVEEVVAQAKQQDYVLPAFIEALITSEAFRKKR